MTTVIEVNINIVPFNKYNSTIVLPKTQEFVTHNTTQSIFYPENRPETNVILLPNEI